MSYVKKFLPLLMVAMVCSLSNAENRKTVNKTADVKGDVVSVVDSVASEPVELPEVLLKADTLAPADTISAVLARKDSLIASLEHRLMRADTCYLQLAVVCCERDYKPSRVELAARCMKNIYSEELKMKYEDVTIAVDGYSKYYEEIMQLLRDAQADYSRTISFAVEDYKRDILNKLQNTTYKKEFLSKKRMLSLTYIDKIYSDAEAIIRKHTQDHPADFSELLSR